MTDTNKELLYKLMIIGFPILSGLLSIIGVFIAKALLNLVKNVNEINIAMKSLIAKHDGLEKRVDKIENKLFK
jgi:hypothetical protein